MQRLLRQAQHKHRAVTRRNTTPDLEIQRIDTFNFLTF